MKYDLVLEGGGAKGIALVGAMRELLERGHKPGRLLGTSAGAITATLVAAGYGATEMLDVLDEKVDGKSVFTTFMSTPGGFSEQEIRSSMTATYLRDIDIPLLPDVLESRLDNFLLNALLMHPGYRHLFSFVERGGWFAADNFLTWMARLLDTGAHDGEPRAYSGLTMAEFFDAGGVHLTLIASDTTDQRMLVLNHITTPTLPLIWAVRMSMSIPFVWPEVVWRREWGLYREREIAGHAIVDGGLLSNFPVELYVSNLDHVTAVMGPKQNDNILGLLIDEELEVPGVPPPDTVENVLPDFSRIRTLARMKGLLDTAMHAHDKMVIDAFQHLVVRLPAKDFGTTEFDMTDARRDALVIAGASAMASFLDRPTPDMIPLPPEVAAAAEIQMQSVADDIASRTLD